MTPGPALDDAKHALAINPVVAGESGLVVLSRRPAPADRQYVLRDEPRHADHLASGVELRVESSGTAITSSRPAFAGHVGRIVRRRTNKQVSRIAAQRVVATVANQHAEGDRAVGEFPGYAMGQKVLAPIGELPVTPGEANIRPAVGGAASGNAGPESLSQTAHAGEVARAESVFWAHRLTTSAGAEAWVVYGRMGAHGEFPFAMPRSGLLQQCRSALSSPIIALGEVAA